MKKVIIYTDGGSRGNPGPAASGWVVMDEQENILLSKGKYLGVTTNNVAEYTALIEALKSAQEFSAEVLEIRMDSELIVRQMTGQYKIKQPHLLTLASEVLKLLNTFKSFSFKHIRREHNKLADKMVNETLDSHSK